MGGRGTFGTKQNTMNRETIVNTLRGQGTTIALNGKKLDAEGYSKLNNNDLSILKDLINKPNARGLIVNLTSNFSTKDIGKSVSQKTKTLKSGKEANILNVNRTIYKTRGIKYFNNNLKTQGYEGGMKSVKLNKIVKQKKKVK